MVQDADVIILGAGAAGVAAARRLSGAGLSVTILEALPRSGGRAYTSLAAGLRLDLGCGWLHSADRNPWTEIAVEAGLSVDRSPPAWGTQFRNLGFSPPEQQAARGAYAAWYQRISERSPESDSASDALEDGEWTGYIEALSGFTSGDGLERISVRDYLSYDEASSHIDYRIREGYGTLVSSAIPAKAELFLATPVEAVSVADRKVGLTTAFGTINAERVVVTCSTNILAGDTIRWPSGLDPWRNAAASLPLGYNEKLFLEVSGSSPFEAETLVLGDPRDARTGAYYIRPFGWPVIECFLGGASAKEAVDAGPDIAFAGAIGELAHLFGFEVRNNLRPLVCSNWTSTPSVGGAYSHALPGQSDARRQLARSFDGRIFFAGEATDPRDFSTAHGAFQSGLRAADEVLSSVHA